MENDYKHISVQEVRALVKGRVHTVLHHPITLLNPRSHTFYVFGMTVEDLLAAQMFVSEANRALSQQPFDAMHSLNIWSFELTDRLTEADLVIGLKANNHNCKSSINNALRTVTGKSHNLPVITLFKSNNRVIFKWELNKNFLASRGAK